MASSSAQAQQRIHEALADWLEIAGPEVLQQYADEDWDLLQSAAAFGTVDVVRYILGTGVDPNGGKHVQEALALPKMTPLHIAAHKNHTEIIKLLSATTAEIDRQDQWGFTALHYATFKRNKEAVKALLDANATVTLSSYEGTTALEIAQRKNYQEIVDMLASKAKLETDPLVPQFRKWLEELKASEFCDSFLQAGYDMESIAAMGIKDDDLDVIGVPMSRLGLRRKLIALHKFDLFYPLTNEEDEEGSDEEGSDEEGSDEEGSEEEGSEEEEDDD